MAEPISVPEGFREAFVYFCQRAGYDQRETNELREKIRADFETSGKWVLHCVDVYRFMDETWPKGPRPDLCEGYLAALGWYPEDPDYFKKCGLFLQVEMCLEFKRQCEAATQQAA